jgi:hypothetical protein
MSTKEVTPNPSVSRAASDHGLRVVAEDIADASDRLDQLVFERIIDFSPQPANVDVHDITFAFVRHFPDGLSDGRSCLRFAPPAG